MAALAPGVLLKLLNGMNIGTTKPVGEHRSALLQVTDIVPVDLDEKDLLPKHGFYIKVSDSSHSIYVTLPLHQDDLVLSDKIQLGQFIYVDRLEPGTPVPVIFGVKLLPGRHALMGTPEPVVRVKNHGEKTDLKVVNPRRRGSWESEQNSAFGASSPLVVKPTTLNFEDSTPVKVSGRLLREGSLRSSVTGTLMSKKVESKESGSRLMRKSSFLSKIPKNGNTLDTESKIVKSPFSEKSSLCASSRIRVVRSSESCDSKNRATRHFVVPGKLSLLQKEAMKNREAAQKVALQALRDVSATETLVRVLKMFSALITSARPDSPATIFEGYLTFNQEIMQAVIDMEKIREATVTSMESEKETMTDKQKENEDRTILSEQTNLNFSKRKEFELRINTGRQLRTHHPTHNSSIDRTIPDPMVSDEKKVQLPCSLSTSVHLAKDVQTEARNWFMDFLEAALDSGMKKKGEGQRSGKCPQSLILKVINWLEVEQSDGSKIHPRATIIARKLRIKAKNP